MPAIRTQVYLTGAQRERIDQIVRSEGLTLAEVVRRALDAYLIDDVDPQRALESTFGGAPDFEAPSRDEWERG